LENETFDELIKKVIELNGEISRINLSVRASASDTAISAAGRRKPAPTNGCSLSWITTFFRCLQEYWFDDDSKVQRWDNILHGVFQ
jgi:5-methylcytosine-specific restriction protein B